MYKYLLLSLLLITSCTQVVELQGIKTELPEYYHSVPGERPYIGNANATVVIQEYSDFQCPYCKRGAESIDSLMEKYNDKVKVETYMFPIPTHQYAFKAAEAALCANDQGKFWQYHHGLFVNQDSISFDLFTMLASELNLNMDDFNECISTGKYSEDIYRDIQKGSAKGVSGTPIYFINGLKRPGFVSEQYFERLINDILSE